ncbi:hypothetical protein D3C86_1463010 [compost metagenome]
MRIRFGARLSLMLIRLGGNPNMMRIKLDESRSSTPHRPSAKMCSANSLRGLAGHPWATTHPAFRLFRTVRRLSTAASLTR